MNYGVTLLWKKGTDEKFTDGKYSRKHQWIFDGGAKVQASSSPHVVPLPFSDESAVDPEEAFIAALSSCHMLFFLSLAAKRNYVIETYEDNAEGTLSKIENGEMAMTVVNLKPKVTFTGSNIPPKEVIEELHEKSHKLCYIANSVKTVVNVHPIN
jgi:organic hydroperoxide reductase OsmC/OhrA